MGCTQLLLCHYCTGYRSGSHAHADDVEPQQQPTHGAEAAPHTSRTSQAWVHWTWARWGACWTASGAHWEALGWRGAFFTSWPLGANF